MPQCRLSTVDWRRFPLWCDLDHGLGPGWIFVVAVGPARCKLCGHWVEDRGSFGCQQLDCSFDAGSSTDSDGTITAYAWDFGDGTTATDPVVDHPFANGTYQVRLTVTEPGNAEI